MPQCGKKLIIELLNSNHNRSDFQCGVIALDNYIRKQARQDVKRRISQVFVTTDFNSPFTINGYYTLSTLSIELSDLPEDVVKKLPRHPIPAALIGRLAVNLNEQGQGIGKMLLVDAIKRTLSVSSEIAIYAIVVDAIDDKAKQFYQRFGFILFSAESNRLFLPLKSV